MTPVHDDGSSEDDSQRTAGELPPALRPRLQARRTSRSRIRYRATAAVRTARPSTVWLCAQDDLNDGTGLLANWLLGAIVKIVTTYTRPGQRVLLLAPAAYLSRPAGRVSPLRRSHAQDDPYAGLNEASWTVVRLGRGVQTATAVADSEPLTESTVDKSAEPQERSGRDASSAPGEQMVGQSTGRPTELGPVTTRRGPDLYDLIIAAALPQTLGWFRPADWANVLAPTGTLAVITHGDSSGSRFIDPARLLVPAARHAGLRYLDRIALVREPVSDGLFSAATCIERDRSSTLPRRSTVPIRHRSAHTDLLLFTRRRGLPQPIGSAEASDD